MLYWAEGAKRATRSRSTNADPELLAFFADFLREWFAVPTTHDERLLQSLRGPRRAAARDRELLARHGSGFRDRALRKSIVNVYSKYSQKKRRDKLPYGTCALVVHSTRIVQTIYGSIQEYGGFERPEWLGLSRGLAAALHLGVDLSAEQQRHRR